MIAMHGVMELIQESFDSLFNVKLINKPVEVDDNTVLLGDGSTLESIAFVTLVTDLEDRLERANGQPVFVILNDIHEWNQNKSALTAGALSRYIAKLTKEEVSHDA